MSIPIAAALIVVSPVPLGSAMSAVTTSTAFSEIQSSTGTTSISASCVPPLPRVGFSTGATALPLGSGSFFLASSGTAAIVLFSAASPLAVPPRSLFLLRSTSCGLFLYPLRFLAMLRHRLRSEVQNDDFRAGLGVVLAFWREGCDQVLGSLQQRRIASHDV
eukprot:CAMPEP_0206537450 /NCGR_PEP_ID=MMETSP0325_2-20121206/7320_1 /ASSEMBLY_ACC=CAM_ASM_000347 /TAXON_ID=2866 /ORGANISM="Crypthecodinium cohnii, Strain Seligo" /LENGTH=161 /DNA_ID=CAMNT_0054034791 /DNA_START=297 /DNA_END=782 /DNA_ORIENTATION=+